MLGTALSSLQTELMQADPTRTGHEAAYTQVEAQRLAKSILSAPGVTITPHGIRFRGKINGKLVSRVWDPASFAHSQLVKYGTGVLATRANNAAILGNPIYQQQMARLTFERDQALQTGDEQRRRSLLDYGATPEAIRAAFGHADPTLAAQAAGNPFSTTALLARQYGNEQRASAQASSNQGTLFGGGYVSGQAEAARRNTANTTDAATRLQDLLTGLSRQDAATRAAYGMGQTEAKFGSEQNLIATNALDAAQPPAWANRFNGYLYAGWRRRRGTHPAARPAYSMTPLTSAPPGANPLPPSPFKNRRNPGGYA